MPVRRPHWFAIAQRMDTIVDNRFGEPVELHPWTAENFGSGGGPDPARAVLAGPDVLGVYVTQGSKVIGEGSLGGAGGNTQLLEQEVWLSIQAGVLGDPAFWKSDDRVYFPDRNEWYQISYIPPSATYRYNVHLLRLNANALHTTLSRAKVPETRGALLKQRPRLGMRR